MAISFPNSPTTGTTVTVGSIVYTYDGTAWRTAGNSFNGGTITGTLFVNNISVSTSTNTGAVTVLGGVGIGGNLSVSSISVINTTTATSTTTGAVKIVGGIGVGDSVYVGKRVGYVGTANVFYTFYNTLTNSLDTVFE